jgi:hypothetical protein
MSGRLTGLTPEQHKYVTTQVYDRVDSICSELGLRCYCPHKSETDPSKPSAHSKIWKVDFEKVTDAYALVAYVGLASTGVGQEIEFAREDPKRHDIKAIVLCEKKNLDGLSRLTLGSPVVDDQIVFVDPREIDDPLRKWLITVFSEKNLRAIASEERWPVPDLERMLGAFTRDVRAQAFRGLDSPITKAQWRQKRRELLNKR